MTEISVLITGDFCPRYRLENLSATTDVPQVLSGLTEKISQSDLAITNLECPITNHKTPKLKSGPNLKGKKDAVDFLVSAGFNLVTLANNHIMDYSGEGLKDTFNCLEKAGLPYFGAGLNLADAAKIYYFQKEDLRLGLINVAENEWSTTHGDYPGANPIDVLHVYHSIVEAKKNADVVLVISHGGHEMYELPSPRMKALFRGFVDMGADAVINHHTHCVSGYEVYNSKPIFYSIGNFLFDNLKERDAIWNMGQAVLLKIAKNTIAFETITFKQCNDDPKIVLLDAHENEVVTAKIKSFNTVIADDKKLEAAFDSYCHSKSRMYTSYLEPHKNKYLMALQNRKWFPTLWSSRKKLILENLIRCESHRDAVLKILKK